MKENWKECRLGEIVKIKHGYAFEGNSISFDDNNIVLVTPGNFAIGGGFQEKKCKFFHSIYPSEYILKENDLIVTMTDLSKDGDTLGYSAKVPYSDKRIYLHNQRIGLVQFIKSEVDKNFIYWFMRSPLYQKTVLSTSSGSTVKHTSPNRICEISINLPPLATQQKIAAILSSLDDKIELNNRINDNLEQQAQALFKSWFVDFEPFGGKMPEGWRMGKLSEIAEYSNDKIEINKLSPETYYSTENMLPNKGGVETATSLPSVSQTIRCLPGETIISNIRPYFKKIFYCIEEVAGCSTDVLCFKPKKKEYSEYLYQILYSDIFFDYMVLGSKGTKMPRGDKQQIMNYDVIIPAPEYLLKFTNNAKPILKQIALNHQENRKLASVRDSLLPKLMAGEISVESVTI